MRAVLFLIIYFSTFLQAEEFIKFGAIYSLSGFASIAGQSELKAVQLAINEINASGGIKGKKIKLVLEDNQSDFNKTITAYKKLANFDKIKILLGPNWAEFSELVAPLAQKDQVLMLTATGRTENLAKGRDHVFTLLPSHFEALEKFADYILKSDPKKIILVNSVNSFYESLSNGLELRFKEKGVSFYKKYSFNHDFLDYKSAVLKLKQDQPDIIVLFLAETGAIYSFLKSANEMKLSREILFAGPSIPYDESILKNLNLAEGVNYFDYIDTTNSEFKAKYFAKYKTQSNIGSGKAYDSVYLLKDSIQNCGASTNQIINCLNKIQYNGVTGKIGFNSEGEIISSKDIINIFQVKSGKLLVIN